MEELEKKLENEHAEEMEKVALEYDEKFVEFEKRLDQIQEEKEKNNNSWEKKFEIESMRHEEECGDYERRLDQAKEELLRIEHTTAKKCQDLHHKFKVIPSHSKLITVQRNSHLL